MKLHVGVDVKSGAVHRVTVTAANSADSEELPNLLRAEDQAVLADAGYPGDEYKRGLR
jgi:IS5 family transposase